MGWANRLYRDVGRYGYHRESVFLATSFQEMVVAMTASWMQPEVVNHTALILSGAQGVGENNVAQQPNSRATT